MGTVGRPVDVALTWAQALAWRARRHLLDPVGGDPADRVVARLGAVPAASDDAAELAVRVRQRTSEPGEVGRALAEGRLVRTYAFRGATHLLTPADGGAYLALRRAGRMWERASWRTSYRLEPDDWPDLRAVVREALADGPLTRSELGDAVAAHDRFAHLRPWFGDGTDTLLKPLTWFGDMCFAPAGDGRTAFQRVDTDPPWVEWPDLDAAGRHAVLAYLGTYGPATPDRVHYWLGEGLGAGRARLDRWLAELREDALVEVDVEGDAALAPREHADDLADARPTDAVRLLPAFDQWVLGPGTADPRVVPAAHRGVVSRGAAVVTVGGVVAGTWRLTGDDVRVTWFDGADGPRGALAAEIERLGTVLGRDVRPVVER
ncbi:winged helix DNA-binding protein [Cellulosimicrobium cellulans J34]|nr:winged helix DNA-binding protein [Cellulosimicrobium cellulans J34]SMF19435.1 Winged helix DNA-binding domain-containing protein [Cellulosimicrobium cellulans J1]